MNIFRSSRLEIFFKINAQKNFTIFCIKKSLQHICFPVNIKKFLRTAFLKNFSGGCFCIILKVTKGTVMQIEKAPIQDRLCISKASWKFRISTIYSFSIIYPWNLLFFEKVANFLRVSIVFSVYKKTLRLNNLKIITAMNVKIWVFVICVKAIIYLSLYNLYDCTFKQLFRKGYF